MHACEAALETSVRSLTNLATILDKAKAHCEAKKIDPQVLVSARLFPDMFPLARQVQIACDSAKLGLARLAGVHPPKNEDTESTFDELKARIASTLAFLATLKPEQFAGAETREVTFMMRNEPQKMLGLPYVQRMVLPNVFFHVTTAYNILRHNGVEVGKSDYLGKVV